MRIPSLSVVLALTAISLSASTISRAETGSNFSQCYAETVCPVYCAGPSGPYLCNSYSIFCTSWAQADETACTFEWVTGSHVRCTGANSDGEWVDLLVACQ